MPHAIKQRLIVVDATVVGPFSVLLDQVSAPVSHLL